MKKEEADKYMDEESVLREKVSKRKVFLAEASKLKMDIDNFYGPKQNMTSGMSR